MRGKRDPQSEREGVRVIDEPRGRTRVAAAAVAAAGATVAWMLWGRAPERAPRPPALPPLSAAVAAPASPDSPAQVGTPAAPVAHAAPAPPPAAEAAAEPREARGLEDLAREWLDALRAAGAREGIAVFNPPGTDPIRSGLVVPEDFELPEGYVRHYQVTDQGERLEPILMFAPGYQRLDASGRPVALPDDGIVPPELAPPGLPLRLLEVPENPYGAGEREAMRDEAG